MCGIIGVTGEADAVPLILGALHQLEYRGYDSAGIAMVADGSIWRARAAGGTNSVSKLDEMTRQAPTGHAAAIGHTRWATHGSPTPKTPIRTPTAPGASPSSTTGSSRTMPSCGRSWRRPGTP